MRTRAQGLAWLNSTNGKYLDYDHQFGAQCFDFFNFYHHFLTGDNALVDYRGVMYAKNIWFVPTSHYVKHPDSNSLVPQPGDVVVYGAVRGNPYGHVEVCLAPDLRRGGCTMIGENEYGNPSQGVREVFRTWRQINSMNIEGAMRPRWAK